MKLAELKKLLKKNCRHWEEWQCGPAKIIVRGYSPAEPRFDRKMELYLDIPPPSLRIQQIQSLLRLLDGTGHQKYTKKTI